VASAAPGGLRRRLTGAERNLAQLRLVLDPNVLIAAAISGQGAPAQLLSAVAEGQATLVVSPRLLQELRGVLERPKFRRWLSLEEVAAFLDAVELLAEPVDDPPEVDRFRGVPRSG
jgi:putative PIN family toxin of toxin-antitoxin system